MIGPSAGLSLRYTTLGVLSLCCCYFVWLLYSPPAFGGLAEMCLLTGVVLLFASNMEVGRDYGRDLRDLMKSFESDVRAGEPPYRLAKRYSPYLLPKKAITDCVPFMKRAGIGVFRYLQEDPPLQEIPVPLASATAHRMTWREGTAEGAGRDSYLVFTLREPRYVAGINLTYIHSNGSRSPQVLEAYWKGGDQADFPVYANFADRCWDNGQKSQSVVIWIDDYINKIRIHPDQIQFRFKVEKLVLLVPETGPPSTSRDP